MRIEFRNQGGVELNIKSMQVGEMTQEPVKTQFGYHLILVEGRRWQFFRHPNMGPGRFDKPTFFSCYVRRSLQRAEGALTAMVFKHPQCFHGASKFLLLFSLNCSWCSDNIFWHNHMADWHGAFCSTGSLCSNQVGFMSWYMHNVLLPNHAGNWKWCTRTHRMLQDSLSHMSMVSGRSLISDKLSNRGYRSTYKCVRASLAKCVMARYWSSH